MNLLQKWVGKPVERAEAVSLISSWTEHPIGDDALSDFKSYVQHAYYKNGLVFSLVGARARFLSEIEFKFRITDGDNENTLHRNSQLNELRRSMRDDNLIWRMEQDASLQGNAYVHRTSTGALQRLQPNKMQVVSDRTNIRGYFYWPNGIGSGAATFIQVEDIAHWRPVPDPLRPFMGMSWLTPVASEILGDAEMEAHRRRFFANSATPNMIIKIMQTLSPTDLKLVQNTIDEKYGSVENAGKTLVVDRGADVKVVGSSFESMQFVDLQAAGELRVVQAAGIPPQIAHVALGLKASTFTNSAVMFRFWADGSIRPLWRSLAGALSNIVDIPAGSELWFDDSRVSALQQDTKDQAEIFDSNARTIGALIRAGWTADSARDAVVSGNFGLLTHSGLIPNTLQTEDDLTDLTNDGVSPSDEDAIPGDPIEDI